MIHAIDELLQLWAEELHGRQCGLSSPLGRSPLAALMDGGGVLSRGRRTSQVLLDRAAEIELIVNKHLSPALRQVVVEHYCNHDSLQAQKWAACGCGRSQFYRRLGLAHAEIQAQLMRRVV